MKFVFIKGERFGPWPLLISERVARNEMRPERNVAPERNAAPRVSNTK